jgi:hypothetical protein
MRGDRATLRRAVMVVAVALSSTTLTACHELYCNFIEGLTGQPIDCSHDAFPDLPDVPIPSLPPPPSLPTTTTTMAGTTTTSPTSDTTTSTSTTEPTGASTTLATTTVPPDTTTTLPGSISAEGVEEIAERLRRLERVPTMADATDLLESLASDAG